MPLLAGDIRFARSANMADVPEGGGPPSAQLLTSGRSNEIFPDISEETRTVGRVEIYQIFSVLRNTDRAPLLGANLIIAKPPADPNVSITLLTLKDPFATRADIVRRMESGMSPGSEWSGYLLEDHFTSMRSVTLLQRPGMAPPVPGRTYVLVYDEKSSGERRQRVRIKACTTETRTFTEIYGGELIDFQVQLTVCELFDALQSDFPGSPPSRSFARQSDKTIIRETVYSDAGLFSGAGRLAAPTQVNDVWLHVDSIYTQVVPNSRTEMASVDQRPTSRYSVVLAEAPRRVEVGITPHTQRFKIDEANVGLTYVMQCQPLPEPGTVFIDYWVLGQRYTLTDDAVGKLVGQGGGSVSYLTGAVNLTLKAVPDIGSAITLAHGARTGYTNRSGQAGYRNPEFAWTLPNAPVKPGSVVITWTSGGTTRTATDNGNGGITSTAATGEINYAAGKVLLRPTAMVDAGGEFKTDYRYGTTKTENITGVPVDAAGFAAITLQEAPAPRSLSIDWITVRNVTNSAGASDFVSDNSVANSPIYETRTVTSFEPLPPLLQSVPMPVPASVTALSTSNITINPLGACTFVLATAQGDGNGRFDWQIRRIDGAPIAEAFAVTSGVLGVSDYRGVFSIYPSDTFTGSITYEVAVTKFGGAEVAVCGPLYVVPYVAPTSPAPPPAYSQYAYSSLIGFSAITQGLMPIPHTRPDTATAMYFTGPVPDGAYQWVIIAKNGVASFAHADGSFEIKDGAGGFWVVTVPDATVPPLPDSPLNQFVVEVRKADGTSIARTPQISLLATTPTTGWQPPPPTVIKVRDPLTTGNAMTNSGSSSIAGMYAAGVDEAGKTVYVAVPPTGSAQWGQTYNPPEQWDAVWSAADIAAKTKTLTSAQGTQVTYRIWGA